MPVTHQTDVLIIGAGPAGLAAAASCRACGRDFFVIESGQPVERRDHADQRALGTGVGGSGLFSDGKFSYHPSATALWKLPDQMGLQVSWRWFSEAVSPLGLSVPDLPAADAPAGALRSTGVDSIVRKDYDSTYLSLEHRRQLIARLQRECGARLLTNAELLTVRFDPGMRMLRCRIRQAGSVVVEHVVARAAVFAGGRFGPIGWSSVFAQPAQLFKRVEIGVRIEQKSEDFFLADDSKRDPKLILASLDGRYSWRTFCCCRNGDVVTTEVRGVCSVSGRADGPPSGRSNVGFNLRVTDPVLAESLWPNGLRQMVGERNPASQPLVEFLERPGGGGIAGVVGDEVAMLLAKGLRLLCSEHPDLLLNPCLLTAPAIEGIGYYPELTDTLRHGNLPLWVAGDASGVFRGLTAALVSGYFAASQAAGYLE